MNNPLSEGELAALRCLDACTLANTIESFHERLRNEGFMNGQIHCLFPKLPPMLGYAATVRIRGSAPPTASQPYGDRMDWLNYILSLPAPRVVVIEDTATKPGVGSLVGAVHMNILKALNCVGVVTNGAVRDLTDAESVGFHYYAGSVSVSHAYVHIVGFGEEVEVGGLKVKSGDLLHADMHGVQSIPLNIASKIPSAAEKLYAAEHAIIALCRSPEFSLEKLRAAINQGESEPCHVLPFDSHI